MQRSVILVAAFVGALAANAQVSPTPQQPALITDECLLVTTEEAWTALGLSADQVKEVMAIQTRCKTDCVAVKEGGDPDPAANQAILEKHRELVRKVITEEQYKKWLEWCAGRDAHGQVK